MKKEIERHGQLLNLGFTLDGSDVFGIYNHECGTWIADFALEQYGEVEWYGFINEFHNDNLKYLTDKN